MARAKLKTPVKAQRVDALIKKLESTFETIGKTQKRIDGWSSIATGMGTHRDKVTSVGFFADVVDYRTAQELWRGDDMAARTIELWPEEMLREGFILTTKDQKDVENQITAHLDKLNFTGVLTEAIQYKRAYGGGAILIGANDGAGEDLTIPLNVEKVTSVDFITAFDARECIPSRFYDDPSKPKCGKPSHYRLNIPAFVPDAKTKNKALQTIQTREIHESRFIIFDGFRPNKTAQFRGGNNGWGDSSLNRLWPVLRGYNLAWGAVWHLISEFSQGIYKIKGLAELNDLGHGEAVTKRLTQIDYFKSVMRAIVVDSESEEYERLSVSLAGLETVINQGNIRLAAAAGMPLTVLMGESPGGLGSNGSSEIRSFYSRVAAMQTKEVAPAIMQMCNVLSSIYNLNDGYTVQFPPLWAPTDLETAQARNTQANTDVAYINAGVLTPDEVAKARFGSSEYKFDTPVDFAAREALEQLGLGDPDDDTDDENPTEPNPETPSPTPTPPISNVVA